MLTWEWRRDDCIVINHRYGAHDCSPESMRLIDIIIVLVDGVTEKVLSDRSVNCSCSIMLLPQTRIY